MTSKEALKDIYNRNEVLKKEKHFHIGEKVMNIMKELVERDTPMKVNSYEGSIFREYKCQCGQHFNSFYHLVELNFCPKCGQRIDWS